MKVTTGVRQSGERPIRSRQEGGRGLKRFEVANIRSETTSWSATKDETFFPSRRLKARPPLPRPPLPHPTGRHVAPHSPTAPLPPADGALLDEDWLAEWPGDPRSAPLRSRAEEEEEEEEKEGGTWEDEALLRAQRGDLGGRLLSLFPVGLSLEGMNYQEGGEGEEGGKRNEALTSIAGGLQAVSREKGGFGFRFGRKRWSDRGWMD